MELIDAKQDESWHYIQTILDSGRLPYTQNRDDYQATRDKYFACYKDAWAGHTVFVLPDSTSSAPSADTPGDPLSSSQDKAGTMSPNHGVGSGRFVDLIDHFKSVDITQEGLKEQKAFLRTAVEFFSPSSRLFGLMDAAGSLFTTKILGEQGQPDSSLNEKLELGQANATARCKTYIQEDVGIAAERDELNKTKKQLESVWSELLNYGFPSSPTD